MQISFHNKKKEKPENMKRVINRPFLAFQWPICKSQQPDRANSTDAIVRNHWQICDDSWSRYLFRKSYSYHKKEKIDILADLCATFDVYSHIVNASTLIGRQFFSLGCYLVADFDLVIGFMIDSMIIMETVRRFLLFLCGCTVPMAYV